MTITVDLHCHSTASDGTLTPAELVARAAAGGVGLLALTDHDSTDGLSAAAGAAERAGLKFVPGIELSVAHSRKPLHVTGLGIDPEQKDLHAGLRRLRELRNERADEIGRRLAKRGIPGMAAAARALAGEAQVTRTHFARALLNSGQIPNMDAAFKRYLGHGKPAYVPSDWISLEQGLEWIHAAGGASVLAHPLSYRYTGAWLSRILEAFAGAGGIGIEVVCGTRNDSQSIARSAGYARRYGLLGSVGSDFHTPDNPHIELGRLSALPESVQPIWTRWL